MIHLDAILLGVSVCHTPSRRHLRDQQIDGHVEWWLPSETHAPGDAHGGGRGRGGRGRRGGRAGPGGGPGGDGGPGPGGRGNRGARGGGGRGHRGHGGRGRGRGDGANDDLLCPFSNGDDDNDDDNDDNDNDASHDGDSDDRRVPSIVGSDADDDNDDPCSGGAVSPPAKIARLGAVATFDFRCATGRARLRSARAHAHDPLSGHRDLGGVPARRQLGSACTLA